MIAKVYSNALLILHVALYTNPLLYIATRHTTSMNQTEITTVFINHSIYSYVMNGIETRVHVCIYLSQTPDQHYHMYIHFLYKIN